MDKIAAYVTLHDALMTTIKLLAPFCPHITEEIYQALDGSKGSVHMTDWPNPDLTLVDDRLEASMKTMQELVEEITKERQKKNVKLRWPLKRIIIRADSKEILDILRPMEEVLLSQANVKSVEYVPTDQDWSDLILDVHTEPPCYWQGIPAVVIQDRSHAQEPAGAGHQGSDRAGRVLAGDRRPDRPNRAQHGLLHHYPTREHVVGVKFAGGDLYIDFNMTEEIEAEGYTREIIRRIQQMRKDMKLEVEEFVRVEVKAPSTLEEYFKTWKEHIMKETRALQMEFTNEPKGEHVANWEVEKHKVDIAVSSLHMKEGVKNFTKIPGITMDAALALVKSGRHTIDDLKGMDENILSEVPGLTRADARNIVHYLVRQEAPVKEEQTAQMKDEAEAVDKERMFAYLKRVPRMNDLKAEMVYDAGYSSVDKLTKASKEDLRAVKGLSAKTVQEIMDYAAAGGFTRVTECRYCKRQVQPYETTCPACNKPVVEERSDEEGEGAEELIKGGKKASALEPSFTYLIKEDKSDRSYAMFVEALGKGMKGYCITRDYPLKIRSKFNLGDTPIVWLSNIGKENSLRPKDLEKLSFSLEQFLSNQGGVILLDGLEYLITNNNFLTVLRFIQSLRDQVAINHSILLLAMNPSTLDPHELNLLEKEVDVTF